MANVDGLRSRQTELKAEIEAIDKDADGEAFTDEQRVQWNAANEEFEANRKHIEELEARMERIASMSEENVEAERVIARPKAKSRVPDDPHDVAAYRNLSNSMDDLHGAYREGALKIVESVSAAHADADIDASQERMERLLKTRDEEGMLARRLISTSSPTYERAFGKWLGGASRTTEEERALSQSSASAEAATSSTSSALLRSTRGSSSPVSIIAATVK